MEERIKKFLVENWFKSIVILIIILIGNVIVFNYVSAHPGNTAADGCHYCRTNCDRWGVPWNERHCHGGGSSSVGARSKSEESSTWPYWVGGIALIYGIFWWFSRKK